MPLNDRLRIWIEEGPNAQAREWAARMLACICGFPFSVNVLHAGMRPAEGPTLYFGPRRDVPGVSVATSGYFDGEIARGEGIRENVSGTLEGVPVLFGSGAVERSRDASRIDADVLASAFIIANRLEERFSAPRDTHGRFLAAASFLGANNLLDVPVIDLYAGTIASELRRIYPALTHMSPWPDGRDAAVCVTHDIETLAQPSRLGYLRYQMLLAGRVASRGAYLASVEKAYAGFMRAMAGTNPAWSFDRLRAVERPWPGTYYFFGGPPCKFDGQYDVASAKVSGIIRDLAKDGCEVGVHFGYETGSNAASMAAQKSRVEAARLAPVYGARHHYLRADFPRVWRAHADAGFAYDASLGYAEAEGFRAGTSYPFRPFDLDAGNTLALYEVPLVAMDGTFFQYRKFTADETIARVSALAGKVCDVGGVFTLLWHNTTVDPFDRPEPSRAYTRVVEALKTRRVWGATVNGCVEAWRSYCAALEATE